MTPTPRLLTAAILISAILLTACSGITESPSPTAAASSSPQTVEPLAGESSSKEGWVGHDELPDDNTPEAAVDAHPDAPPSQQELQAALATADQVILGWLTADQTHRRDTLQGVAAEALIDGFDDHRFTPVAQRQAGPTHLVEADQMQIITRHRLDTGEVVDLTLILEPDSTRGWIAIAITI